MASINNYKKFAKADLVNKEGGYKNVVLFAPVNTFDSLQAPVDTGTLGDRVTITGDHTFLTDEGFISLLCKKHSVTLTSETVGEDGAKSKMWKASFIILGDSAELQQQLEDQLNDDCIFLLKDQDCINADAYIQLGDDCVTPDVTVAFNGKTSKEGLKEYTVEISVKAKKFWYEGVMSEKPTV